MASTKIYENREHSLQSEQVIPESPVKASSERLEYYRGRKQYIHLRHYRDVKIPRREIYPPHPTF